MATSFISDGFTCHAGMLWRDRHGIAAVEAALVSAFVLLPMLFMMVGSGEGLYEQYRIDRALHSALISAWGDPTLSDSAIAAAAEASYGVSTTPMAAVSSHGYFCIQPTGTRASGTATTASGSCATGQVKGIWVTVALSAQLHASVPLPGGLSAWSLQSAGTARVQ